jgi:hypothetical protein
MRLVTLVTVVAACMLAPPALADGLPVLGIDVGSTGVTVPGGMDRYVTVNEPRTTLVERIARAGGRVVRLARVPGNFTIPAVAYDASSSGLAADGSALVLIEPRRAFPRAMTRFVLLDAHTLAVLRTISLRGDFSFDAVSAHGTTMFLVNYTSPSDPTRYTVRAYDLQQGALLPKAVRDPAEAGDKMRGSPITRMQSPDGRWAYTLYDGAGGTPFVHALDTAQLGAHCVDLPMLAGRHDLWTLRFTFGKNEQLRVGKPGVELASVDLTTFEARVPVSHGAWSSRSRVWLPAALLAALVATTLVGAAARRRVRGQPAPTG